MAVAAAAIRRPTALLLGSALMVGRLSGEVAWLAEESRCPARMPDRGMRLTVRLLEPVDDAGGRIAVQPFSQGCSGSVIARWPRGRAAASGTEATVEGRWMARPGRGGRPSGTLVIGRVGRLELRPGLSDRLRTYLFETSHRLYGARAGMVDALILGRRGGIDPELQDRFA